MKNYLIDFLKKFEFPLDSHKAFTDAFDKIASKEEYLSRFKSLLKIYADDMDCDYVKLVDDGDLLASECGVHPYTFKIILHIFMAEILRGYYKRKNIPESYWYDSMLDLRYQAETCKLVKDIWGAFCGYWFIYFFQLKRFSFGRLQIEIIDFNREYDKNGLVLSKDSKVFNVHIPRTGGKLDKNEVDRAYEDAMEFYKKYFNFNSNVFFCHTWLLFPDNLSVLKPDSNMAKFINDYDVFEVELKDDYQELYRLFDMEYTGDVSVLPTNTSLQRAYIEWIKQGKKIGIGCGIHIHH